MAPRVNALRNDDIGAVNGGPTRGRHGTDLDGDAQAPLDADGAEGADDERVRGRRSPLRFRGGEEPDDGGPVPREEGQHGCGEVRRQRRRVRDEAQADGQDGRRSGEAEEVARALELLVEFL